VNKKKKDSFEGIFLRLKGNKIEPFKVYNNDFKGVR